MAGALLRALTEVEGDADDLVLGALHRATRAEPLLVALMRALLAWPRALHHTLRSRRQLLLVARLSRSKAAAEDEAPPVRALAHLLLFAAAGDGALDRAASSMLPRLLPNAAAVDGGDKAAAVAEAVARVLRRLEHEHGKRPATLALLTQLCRGDKPTSVVDFGQNAP